MATDRRPPARFLEANRAQLRLVPTDLDGLVREEDPVRSVWAFVEGLDLSSFYEQIRAVEGEPGRPAIDPKILLALWIQATLEGVGSAREIARLCETDVRYQWICGGVTPGYHRLSDFRSTSEQALSALLTDSVTVLLHRGLASLERVAHDGMRVRASAGTGSFRSKPRLRELRGIAREQVDRLREELDQDPEASTRRQKAARVRAAEQRSKRVEQALEELDTLEEKKKKSKNGKKKSEARASTTDPKSRVMKMADGGFRPAWNVHFVSDTVSKCILAVEVSNEGSDQPLMVPMADQVHQRYAHDPREWLTDGGCVSLAGVDALAERQTAVIAPLRAPRKAGVEPTCVRPSDSDAVAAWRGRMAQEETKKIYRQRGATAELVNAHVRRRGLLQFLVRGVTKVRAVALLHALVHNFQRSLALA